MASPADKRLTFNEVPDVYDEIRPSYPVGLFDVLFGMLPSEPVIVEVGPGTGQATKDLLARGASVHAVEIGPATADKLRENLPTSRLRVSVGDFETIDLPGASADTVFSATAYHWISPAGQVDRPAHLLRSGGLVAIVDLIQVTSAVDGGFFDAATPIYERYGEGDGGVVAPRREEADPPMRKVLDGDPRFEDVAVRRWDWDQSYTATEYRKLMLSYSGTQMMGERQRLGLLDDMESLINDEFAGQIRRPLVATLTTATLT
ncbi:MAG: class I SAM-dependent methyltransferase [Acidimicrobiales bacterium]